jgi:hypothetical protein
MPFTTSRFQEIGEQQIIDNLLAVIDRDMKLALDYFFAASDFPDFANKTLGKFMDYSAFPLLVIDPDRMSSEEPDSGEWVSQTLIVGLAFAVKDTKPDVVTRTAIKYVRALKAVLRSAPTSDLLPSSTLVLDHVIDIDHRYLPLGKKGTDWVKEVSFDLRIRYGEK